MEQTQSKDIVSENRTRRAEFNYAFDCGYQFGYGEGKVCGEKEGFSKGFESAVLAVFHDLNSFQSTVAGAELFIKRFNERFHPYSILQARIGVNPSTMTPTAFFVTNTPKDKIRELDRLKREVEREIMASSDARPISVWSVRNENICEDSIRDDFPMARKAV